MRSPISSRLGRLLTVSAGALTVNPGAARHSIHLSASATLPKVETGVASLLKSSPEADGRGVLVAVLDTGCDLAAAGLLRTSDGRPKYVNFFDCTGGGDVDTSKVVKRNDDGTVTGTTGRRLRLGAWAEGVEEFRVGAVSLYSLLPTSVARRVKAERKAAFSATQHAAVAEAQRALSLAVGDKAMKQDAKVGLKQLNELMEQYNDEGPLMDVLLYELPGGDGGWRAVIGTGSVPDETVACTEGDAGGVDLSALNPMAPYGDSRDVGDLGFGTAVSYCVQVYEGGDVCCIVADAGSHGTHVGLPKL